MTEKEIEAYLINNEKIGVIFGLMPTPVRKWLKDKYDNKDFSENILVYRYSDWTVWNEDPFSDDEAVAMIRSKINDKCRV